MRWGKCDNGNLRFQQRWLLRVACGWCCKGDWIAHYLWPKYGNHKAYSDLIVGPNSWWTRDDVCLFRINIILGKGGSGHCLMSSVKSTARSLRAAPAENDLGTGSTVMIGPYFKFDWAVKDLRTFGPYFYIAFSPEMFDQHQIQFLKFGPKSLSRSQTERKPARSFRGTVFDDQEGRDKLLDRALSLWYQGSPRLDVH